MDEPRWLTYRELAAETGLSLPAAEARARRMVKAGRWRHRIDNEPPKAVRVLVTPAEIEAMRHQGALGGAQPEAQEGAPGGMDPNTINALLAELKAAHEQVAGELRRRAERAEAEAAALREAVGREGGRADAEGRARAAAAAERDAARTELARWTAGGPLARAWRSFRFRPGRG